MLIQHSTAGLYRKAIQVCIIPSTTTEIQIEHSDLILNHWLRKKINIKYCYINKIRVIFGFSSEVQKGCASEFSVEHRYLLTLDLTLSEVMCPLVISALWSLFNMRVLEGDICYHQENMSV